MCHSHARRNGLQRFVKKADLPGIDMQIGLSASNLPERRDTFYQRIPFICVIFGSTHYTTWVFLDFKQRAGVKYIVTVRFDFLDRVVIIEELSSLVVRLNLKRRNSQH